ncbi:AMP-binding protein [Azospirillum sp. RWY-5-1]|uniref:AMP-binding protein n=1 Tax=Azospirillum oleiclasticum TaxID=2735135 RepID=A0ABX2TG59_9PROT|nr:AMP-binding protein [Azospirillum oleiclasticum]NYZ16157.1 AMP-binding protein [Azospirillum oleiclasticum]NYZ23037.1 AMP-binding protein [Azospirillum oleiclasticum]
MSIEALLTRAARLRPDRTAVFEGERPVWSYRGLARHAASLAAGLAARHGLVPGDRVALVMRNCPDYIALFFACWRAGLVCVPVNAKLHAREVAYILDHAGARVVFATSDLAATVHEALTVMDGPQPAVVEVGGADHRALAGADPAAAHDVLPGDPAWLFYTSGTTGRPKGAVLSHRNLMAMALGYLAEVDATAPEDCVLHPAPLSHGSGMYMVPHVLAMAAQVVPESGKFDPAEVASLLRHHRGCAFFAAPTIVTRLIDAGVIGDAERAGLKTIIYGGGPMYVEDCKRALAVLGPRLVQIYGQGESPMTVSVLPRAFHVDAGDGSLDRRLASVGYPQGVVSVRIAGPDDETLPDGEVGEVLVRGDTVMSGYWNNPDATAATLRGGWLHTGDLGSLDAEGLLTLKDRSKDVIITGGTNVYPREVEEVLLRHEAVAEVSVFGRRHPDWGEVVVAAIALRGGGTLPRAELDRLCDAHIARFKRPKEYLFLDTLPKNSNGKILKTELRKQAEQPT